MASRFSYRVVSSNGAASYSNDKRSLRVAKRTAEKVLAANITPEAIEIERVEALPSGGNRYWVRRGSRWVLWDATADADERKPDFCLRRGKEQGEHG